MADKKILQKVNEIDLKASIYRQYPSKEKNIYMSHIQITLSTFL